jgi:hypothetical protein
MCQRWRGDRSQILVVLRRNSSSKQVLQQREEEKIEVETIKYQFPGSKESKNSYMKFHILEEKEKEKEKCLQ